MNDYAKQKEKNQSRYFLKGFDIKNVCLRVEVGNLDGSTYWAALPLDLCRWWVGLFQTEVLHSDAKNSHISCFWHLREFFFRRWPLWKIYKIPTHILSQNTLLDFQLFLLSTECKQFHWFIGILQCFLVLSCWQTVAFHHLLS